MVVRIWGTAIAEEIGKPLPDCTRCRRPESVNLRERWGCDAESERVVFTTGCSRCFGSDDDCPDCDAGVVSVKRCPSSFVESYGDTTRRAAGRAVRAYVQFDQRGVLPGPGGFEDQSPQFAQVVDLIDHERGRWTDEQTKYRDRKRPK